MPKTSVGQTTTGFSIGGSIGGSASGPTGGINAGYTNFYSKSGVSTAVSFDSPAHKLSVRTNFHEGCRDWSLWPWYKGAAVSARESYDVRTGNNASAKGQLLLSLRPNLQVRLLTCCHQLPRRLPDQPVWRVMKQSSLKRARPTACSPLQMRRTAKLQQQALE